MKGKSEKRGDSFPLKLFISQTLPLSSLSSLPLSNSLSLSQTISLSQTFPLYNTLIPIQLTVGAALFAHFDDALLFLVGGEVYVLVGGGKARRPSDRPAVGVGDGRDRKARKRLVIGDGLAARNSRRSRVARLEDLFLRAEERTRLS